MADTKDILILSDLHVGSYWGLWPNNFECEDEKTGNQNAYEPNTTQRKLLAWYNEMLGYISKKKIECIILNGDLVEGYQRKEYGRGTIPDLSVQIEACVNLLERLPDVPMYFTRGSGYHVVAGNMSVEQFIARDMGGIYGDDLLIEEAGIRMHAQHHVPVSNSSWQYRCYSDDTEVLTPNGWKKHLDVLPSDSIAVFNPANGKLSFEVPVSFYTYPYSGNMIEFSNQKGSNVLVTPNHKMWVRCHDGTYGFKEAHTLLSKRRVDTLMTAPFESIAYDGATVSIPRIGTEYLGHTPKNVDVSLHPNDWCEFIGYYLSEGGRQKDPSNSNHQVTFAQKKEDKAMKMETNFKKIGFHFSKTTSDLPRWVFNRKQLWTALEQFGSDSIEKNIPRIMFSFPNESLSCLFDALMLGDGTMDPRTGFSKAYYTTSPALALDMQELSTRLGYPARVAFHYPARKPHHHDGYRVYIKSFNTASLFPKQVDYNGNVVCFQTSTGLYLTRRPGYYPTIQGNSTPLARDLLLHALNASTDKYGRVDVAIRSHAHYFVSVLFRSQLGLISPCWQTRTPYAVKKDIVTPPDIGYVILQVEDQNNIMVNRHGINHIEKPCKTVNRGSFNVIRRRRQR